MANSGKDYKFWASPSGVTTSGLVLVEYQGEGTLDTGISLESTAFKVETATAQGRTGFKLTIPFNPRDPMPTGQSKLWDAFDNDTQLYGEFKGATGSMRHKGVFKVAITEITNPVTGLRSATAMLYEDGTITRDVTP